MITPADETLLRRAVALAARTTLYTSCQPCSMCAGALQRSGLGRVVFALSTAQLVELNPDSGAWPTVPQHGPALFDEARAPIEAHYRPAGAGDR